MPNSLSSMLSLRKPKMTNKEPSMKLKDAPGDSILPKDLSQPWAVKMKDGQNLLLFLTNNWKSSSVTSWWPRLSSLTQVLSISPSETSWFGTTSQSTSLPTRSPCHRSWTQSSFWPTNQPLPNGTSKLCHQIRSQSKTVPSSPTPKGIPWWLIPNFRVFLGSERRKKKTNWRVWDSDQRLSTESSK